MSDERADRDESADREDQADRGQEAEGSRSPKAGRAARGARAKVAGAAKRVNESPRLVTAARLARELLPGDSRFGDPLSTAGAEGPQVVGKRLSELTAERPGSVREVGLAALQVWQALSEAQGRGRGHEQVTIVFTDLGGYSTWTLDAGDTAALELLRDVGEAVERPVADNGGRVVKRLGDGLMAVFEAPQPALDALLDARGRVGEIELEDYSPQLRASIHVGQPRQLGGDYVGVDVNVAARLLEAADGEEILVSDRALGLLDSDELKVKRRRMRAKGTPKDLTAYTVDRPG